VIFPAAVEIVTKYFQSECDLALTLFVRLKKSIESKFWDILTTLFQHSNDRRLRDGNLPFCFFLL
jgi:hypothetical protein